MEDEYFPRLREIVFYTDLYQVSRKILSCWSKGDNQKIYIIAWRLVIGIFGNNVNLSQYGKQKQSMFEAT